MTSDLFLALPARKGHFVLESGYHTDLWLSLDALLVDQPRVTPLVTALAERLRPHTISAVCGPLLGGAFLAQAVAAALGTGFYYTESGPAPTKPGLFKAEYYLPPELRRRVREERVAVVDDVISAGSSVRATISALTAAGATTAAVGALLILGNAGLTHFADHGIPVEALARRDFVLWNPTECPLCRAGYPLEDPRRSSSSGDA
jgi:orotate phosphoribosyltransferase